MMSMKKKEEDIFFTLGREGYETLELADHLS
jgi:hypothetical protein